MRRSTIQHTSSTRIRENLFEKIRHGNSPIPLLGGFRNTCENRINALRGSSARGISDVVVIVELGATKGSYHQFEFAMEQGKRVFVPRPENSNRPAHKGFLDLLSKGAAELRSSEDIVDYIEKTKDPRQERYKRLDSFRS